MKALQFHGYGLPPVLEEISEPALGPDDVLIRVSAAALNPMDLKIGAGYLQDFFPIPFPYTVGTDLAGTVERVGTAVADWRVGDRVIARTDPTAGGAVAELASVPASALVSAPARIPLATAAGLATAAATAWQALVEIAKLQPGQTVLVHGGAGGVGSFAVQIASRLGASVVTTTSPAGADIVRALGAHEVIDYTSTSFATVVSGVDVVVDPIGGDTETASLEVLKPAGVLLALNTPPNFERAAARGLRAEFVFHTSDPARLARVAQLTDDHLTVLVDRTVSISEAVDAYTYLGEGHAKGKVLVEPSA